MSRRKAGEEQAGSTPEADSRPPRVAILERAELRSVQDFALSSPDPEEDITIEQLLELVPAAGHELVRMAYDFAERLHQGQKRLSGKPYIHHPLMVAYYLGLLRMDPPSIAAGLLHDVLEDTEITYEEFAEVFPEPVPEIVRGVTKITRMSFRTNREAQIENLRIMILAMARDIRVVVVKLCDRLHNMKTLKYLAPDRRIAISEETLEIYAPLANRLGMAHIKSEMEDLAMRWIYPEAYHKLARQVAKKRKERESLVDEAIDFLRDHLKPSHPGIIIQGRPKHFWSIHRKMKMQGLTFEQIYDLNALRVICNEESECYEILGLIHGIWPPIPGRFKDYIGMPKKNKYQSLHTTVIGLGGAITEIQIRTQKMHQVAEYGIAAHWAYKEGGPEHLQNDDRLIWLRQLTEWITDPNEPEGLLEALKRDVFADRVLCFTPKGDVIELPANATPIDFAYAIHSKVGEHCVGAKINGRMVNLRSKLNNSDVVEIVTATTGHPSRDWLDYSVTGRARSKIKHWLKARNLDLWVDSGRKALLRLLHERGLKVPTAELDAELAKLLEAYKLQTVNDLLVEIGFGSISPHAALARMKPDWAKPPARNPKRAPKAGEKPRKTGGAIIVDEMEGATARVAHCCQPIPGDDIVAYVTRGRGVTVHDADCPNITRARRDADERERLLTAHWNPDSGGTYSATLAIEAQDRSGLLSAVTGVITATGLFIKGSYTKSDMNRGTALLLFEITVHNKQELEDVLRKVQLERGVIRAERKRRGIE